MHLKGLSLTDNNAENTRHLTFGHFTSWLHRKRKVSLSYGHWYRHTPRHNPKVQYAFKISMTHWILQFALRIAVRSVLHRCASLDIHCWKLLELKPKTFILGVVSVLHNGFKVKHWEFKAINAANYRSSLPRTTKNLTAAQFSLSDTMQNTKALTK